MKKGGSVTRYCIKCGRPIEAAFGFVLGRDVVAALAVIEKGEQSSTGDIRELCGMCILPYLGAVSAKVIERDLEEFLGQNQQEQR